MISARLHPSGSVAFGTRQGGDRSWGDTAVLESVFQVTVLSCQQKSCIVNGAKAHVMVVHEYLSSVFLLSTSFCILTDGSLHIFFEDLLGKTPKVFCFVVHQTMRQHVGLRKLFCHPLLGAAFQEIICVVLDSLRTEGRGRKALPAEQWWPQTSSWDVFWGYWLGCGATCIITCISLTSHQLEGVDGAWPVAHTLVLDLGANRWARLPFPSPLSL